MVNTRKTAIVTGASQGIGAGLVEALLKRDYGVVANSRNITKANPFAASANLALVDGDKPRTCLKALLSRRDTCIALPQRYFKSDDFEQRLERPSVISTTRRHGAKE